MGHFRTDPKTALLVIILLSASTFVSVAPPLTAVKVSQVIIEMLFCWTFLLLYGIERCLNRIFWGSTVLCIAIAAVAVAAPDYVVELSEMGSPRLRGGNIAGTNVVSAFAIILLLAQRRQISKVTMALGLAFFSVLQFLSLTRTSWVALVIIFLGRNRAKASDQGNELDLRYCVPGCCGPGCWRLFEDRRIS